MRRLSILALLIGFSVMSVSVAKDTKPVTVSVSDQGLHYEAITVIPMAQYISLETGEVILPFASALVTRTMESKSGEVFHPPSSNGNILAVIKLQSYQPPKLDIRKFRRDYANGVRC